MNHVLIYSLCLFLGLLACNSPSASGSFQSLDVAAFENTLHEQDIQLLDVRTPEETAYGVIGDALVIDFRSEGFKEKISALDRSVSYGIYCKSGGRSAKTLALMQKLNFKSVIELTGGYEAWTKYHSSE